MKLIVVIPAFNEEHSIALVLRKIPRHFHPDIQVEALVVDDGSTDRTVSVAREEGADHILSFGQNRGLGAAVREGLRAAYNRGADIAVMIDADDEYPADYIPQVIAPVLLRQADYVMGSRFHSGTPRDMKLYRKWGNRFFTGLQRVLLGVPITDGQSGFRAFSRAVLRDFDIVHDYNYAQVLTISIVRQGYRLAEVPIPYRVRTTGTSFITWRYVVKVAPAIAREWLRLDKRHPVLYDSDNETVEKSPS